MRPALFVDGKEVPVEIHEFSLGASNPYLGEIGVTVTIIVDAVETEADKPKFYTLAKGTQPNDEAKVRDPSKSANGIEA